MSNTAVQAATRPDYSAEQLANWLARHEEFAALARNGECEVVFFGDSLTDHWRTRGRAVWDRWFAPLRSANFGIAGDRTQQVLWRMTHGELDGLSPKVVVLLIGTNNTDPGLGENSLTPRNSPREIIAGVTAIVRLLRTRFPEAWILLHGLFPRGASGAPVRDEIAVINAGLQLLDDPGQGVRFIDVGPHLLAAAGTGAFMPDLTHLAETGYKIWADALREPLAELLGASPKSIA